MLNRLQDAEDAVVKLLGKSSKRTKKLLRATRSFQQHASISTTRIYSLALVFFLALGGQLITRSISKQSYPERTRMTQQAFQPVDQIEASQPNFSEATPASKMMMMDTDGDGISDTDEMTAGTDSTDPCDPAQGAGYAGYDSTNMTWANADCDGDGVTNGQEAMEGTDPYDNCDLNVLSQTLAPTSSWENADCDGDGIININDTPASTCLGVIAGSGEGFDPANIPPEGYVDSNWMVVAIPANMDIADSLLPYPAYVPNPSVFPAPPWNFTNVDGIEVDGSTYYWISSTPDASSFTGLTDYNWIVEQDIIIPSDGDYDFTFTCAGDNAIEFYIDGTITYTDSLHPVITGGTQIGARHNSYQTIGTLSTSNVTLTAGVHKARMVLFDFGGLTAALISGSKFEYECSSPLTPCDSMQLAGYTGFDSTNTVWREADCDGDGILNGAEADAGTDPYNTDTDGDGVNDDVELENGSDGLDPCDPTQNAGYTSYDSTNILWGAGDCDGDGVTNTQELSDTTDMYDACDFKVINQTLTPDAAWDAADCDGDGVTNAQEITDATDPNDNCDFILANQTLTPDAAWDAADCDGDGVTNAQEITDVTDPNDNCDFILANQTLTPDAVWDAADCDGDGVTNAQEITDATDPTNYCDLILASQTLTPDSTWNTADCDGDGVTNAQEITDGTDGLDPCAPAQSAGYTGYDSANMTWDAADCDGDGVTNGQEVTDGTDPYDNCDLDPDNQTLTPDAVWDAADCDGDGVTNAQEITDATDPTNYCDLILASQTLTPDSTWNTADCDGDGFSNAQEISDTTNSLDPCDPVQSAGFTGYDSANTTWANADCDGDGVSNGREAADGTDMYDSCELNYQSLDTLPSAEWESADCDGDGVPNGEDGICTELFAGSGQSAGSVDSNWIVVAIPTNPDIPKSALPYPAYIPATSVFPGIFTSSTGYTADGVTNYWISATPNANSFTGLTNYNWIVEQTFTIPASGSYDFTFTCAGDNAIEFWLDGTIDTTNSLEPVITGGIQIGSRHNSFSSLGTLSTQGVYLEAGEHKARMVLFDFGGLTAALITGSEFTYRCEDPLSPCMPEQEIGYMGFDTLNTQWLAADCDGDGVPNGQELKDGTGIYDETSVSGIEALPNMNRWHLLLFSFLLISALIGLRLRDSLIKP